MTNRPADSRLEPLSLQQEHIWLSPNRAAHNIPPMVAEVRGQLDLERLRRAFVALCDRHEILRTCVFARPGQDPKQLVMPAVAVDLEVIDLCGHATPDAAMRALGLIRERGAEPFDLEQPPLLRAGIIRLPQGETLLWVIVHHLLSDLWSMRILLRELNEHYSAPGHGAQSSPLRVQYRDYVHWQREMLRGDALERSVAYWGERLQWVRPHLMHLSRPEDGAGEADGGLVRHVLARELAQDIKALARSHRSTPFMTFFAGFQILLWLYTADERSVVDTLVANRTHVDFEPLIGMFAGTMPVLSRLSGHHDCAEAIRRTSNECLDMFGHQHLTFRKAAELLARHKSSGDVRRPQLLFSMQKSPVDVGDATRFVFGDERAPGLALYERSVFHRPLWDQTWQIWQRDDTYEILIRYAKGMFDRHTILRMYEDYARLLRAIVSGPGRTLNELRRRVPIAFQPAA